MEKDYISNENQNLNDTPKKREVFIYPAKISRRILSFLADVIICLMLALLFFQSLAIPIGYSSTNYSERSIENGYNTNYRCQILYDNELLFSKDDKERFIFQSNLVTTSNRFIEYYVTGNSDVYDVIYNYFIEIKGNDISYINQNLIKYGEIYFDKTKFNSNGTFALKEEYKTMFLPNFVYDDEMSKDGKKEYQKFSQSVFLSLYGDLINDIKTNDLTSKLHTELKSYNYYHNEIETFEVYYQSLITICAYSSFFLSAIVSFFVVPLVTEKHQTISEKIMKLERVNLHNFRYMSKGEVVEIGIISTCLSLVILMFIPVATVGFDKMLAFSYLTVVSLVAIFFIAIQLILLCANKLNRTLKELSTNSIVVDTETIDEYYKELGYGN